MSRISAMTLTEAIEGQTIIADALSTSDLTGCCAGDGSCLKQKGGYLNYDTKKMCRACAVFWFADCAKILLQDLIKEKRR